MKAAEHDAIDHDVADLATHGLVDGLIKCDRCSRIVPIAPGFRSVSVPHVSPVYYSYADVRNAAYPRAASIKWCVLGTPCDGNKKRTARDEYVPDGWMLAHQYTVLEEDAYWEGL